MSRTPPRHCPLCGLEKPVSTLRAHIGSERCLAKIDRATLAPGQQRILALVEALDRALRTGRVDVPWTPSDEPATRASVLPAPLSSSNGQPPEQDKDP
jgi:hypothetical protein